MRRLSSSKIKSLLNPICYTFGIIIALLLNSCGSDTTESSGSANFDQLWSGAFSRCGSCHGRQASGTEGGPDLSDKATFTANLLGKTGADYPDWTTFAVNREDCMAIEFIKSKNSSQSLLVAIFDQSVASSIGCIVKDHREMPQSIPMSSSLLQSLKDWIDKEL